MSTKLAAPWNKVPHPSKPGIWISAQRLWQIKVQAAGRCRNCGRPREGRYSARCDHCQWVQNMRSLAAYYRHRAVLKTAEVA